MNTLNHFTEGRLVELTRTLVSIPSETGSEQATAGWLAGFLSDSELQGVTRLPIEDAGDTVHSTLRGTGGNTRATNEWVDTASLLQMCRTMVVKVTDLLGVA